MEHSSAGKTKVICAGLANLILTMGLARFAYTPLLPLMQTETGLSNFAGGWLASINYLGYLAGALISASVRAPSTKLLLYRVGLVLAVSTTVAMGCTDQVAVWAVLRFLGGLSTAAGMFIGSGLILGWLLQIDGKPRMGRHFAGLGLGIAVSAFAVWAMTGWFNYSQQWIGLGALGFVLLLPAWAWTPGVGNSSGTSIGRLEGGNPTARRWIILFSGAYFCAGFSYVIGATFIVAIVEKTPTLAGYGSFVWMLVGVSAAAACALWDHVARRYGDLKALMVVYVLHLASFLLPILGDSTEAWLLSAMLFGVTFLGIVSLTLAAAGRTYPSNPSGAMARLTLSYGLAQVIAPFLGGYLARTTGSYQSTFIMGAVASAAGIAFLFALGRAEERHGRETLAKPTAFPDTRKFEV